MIRLKNLIKSLFAPYCLRWSWCGLCDTYMLICPKCGNNCCNGGYGKLSDDSMCELCESVYELQTFFWKKSW